MASREPRPEVVAILNSNEDLVRLVRETLHDEGYLTMAHHIADLRDGNTDIGRFFEERNPRVVIYDLAPPFTLDWQFLQLLKEHSALMGRRVILTTTNAVALKEVCGVEALQIVGTDEDLRRLLSEVKQTARPVR
jgi:hypothetical protein